MIGVGQSESEHKEEGARACGQQTEQERPFSTQGSSGQSSKVSYVAGRSLRTKGTLKENVCYEGGGITTV